MQKKVNLIALLVNGKFDESLLFAKAEAAAGAADMLEAQGDRVVAANGVFCYDHPVTDTYESGFQKRKKQRGRARKNAMK